MTPVIVDGCWGSNEMQLMTVLLNSNQYEVVAATTVFGSTDLDTSMRNAGRILQFLKAQNIPYFWGTKSPRGSDIPIADIEIPSNGIGNVQLPPAVKFAERINGVDFILKTLRANDPGTVVITATGPLTNIARAYAEDPDTMGLVKDIVIMGGCTKSIQAADMPQRKGNATPAAELNFYKAPKDANAVLQSNLPITLLPLNCTQQMSLTPERRKAIQLALIDRGDIADKVLRMMSATKDNDRKLFNSDPFLPGMVVGAYLENPHNFRGEQGTVTVSHVHPLSGRSVLKQGMGSTYVVHHIGDPDELFGDFLHALKVRFSSKPYQPSILPGNNP